MTVTKCKNKPENKTENDLEERFQWHKGLDPDHIFEDELAMIKKLRKEIPELELETDKFVAVFLFARRHNVDEVQKLLQKFYKKKAEYSHMFPGQHIPSFKYNRYLIDNVIDGGGSMLHPKNKRDNKDRMIRYFYMGLDKPAKREVDETYVSLIWQTYYQAQTEPLNAWRNGLAMVVDLKGAGLSNLDVSSKGREVNSALQGAFPFRIRALMVVNGGWVVHALLTAAKVALPKKLYDRIKMMPESTLKDHISVENLSTKYGGKSQNFTYVEYLAEVAKTEDELFEKGTWKAPAVAVPDGAAAASPAL